jgi:hypothetical protein
MTSGQIGDNEIAPLVQSIRDEWVAAEANDANAAQHRDKRPKMKLRRRTRAASRSVST